MSELFREKSLDRVKSPDALNDYIRVARPSTWLILGAVVLFLVGMIVWGIFGRINVQVGGISLVDHGKIYVLVDKNDIERIQPGMEIRVGEVKGEVEILYSESARLSDVCEQYEIKIGSQDPNQQVCLVEGTIRMADGSYDAVIVLKSLAPIQLLTN